jgi:hypothetical protein
VVKLATVAFSTADDGPAVTRFMQLNEAFHGLSATLLEGLEGRVKASEVLRHLPIVPIEKAIEADDEEALNALHMFLNASMWNFLDYHLLEHIIKEFGSESLKLSMQRYVQDLDEFKINTTMRDLMECWPGQVKMPSQYCEVILKIDKDPSFCTVAELSDLRRELCIQFWPRLSEYAQFILLHRRQWEDLVMWRFPSELTSELEKALDKPKTHALLRESHVLSLSVQNKYLYVGTETPTPGKSIKHEQLQAG